jgi:hypothetical protein
VKGLKTRFKNPIMLYILAPVHNHPIRFKISFFQFRKAETKPAVRSRATASGNDLEILPMFGELKEPDWGLIS